MPPWNPVLKTPEKRTKKITKEWPELQIPNKPVHCTEVIRIPIAPESS